VLGVKTSQDLEKLLKTTIPLSEHMGVHSFNLSAESLSLILPLYPNRNHKQTLFGGSLYSASALACYGLFLAGLRAAEISTDNIVISHGDMKYLAPVNDDALVVAKWSST